MTNVWLYLRHELDVQVFMLMGVPLAGLGEFGIGVGSEPNDHVWLAQLCNNILRSPEPGWVARRAAQTSFQNIRRGAGESSMSLPSQWEREIRTILPSSPSLLPLGGGRQNLIPAPLFQYPTANPSLLRGSVAPKRMPVFSSIMIPSASPR